MLKLFLRFHLKHLVTILFFLLPTALIFAQDTGRLKISGDSSASTQKILTHTDSVYLDSIKKVQNKIFGKDNLYEDSAHKISIASSISKDSDKVLSTTTNTTDSSADILKADSLTHTVQSRVMQKSLQKNKPVILMPGTKRTVEDVDIEFYILIFLLFFLGLIKTSFPKYVNSIFSLSFQATFRQTQTREQMAQNFFPAFMLNVLFVLCGGLFITLLAQFNNWTKLPFWQLFVYATGILLIIYLIKYLVISFTGWVFNAKDAVTEYRFVVFLINKVLGILLLPLLFVIAYTSDITRNISITIVICLAVFSLAVRYLVSLARIRKNLSITAFHFFIYLCAVEIMPLLVIYKLFLQTSNR